jgi:hypothetical protein
MVLARLIHQSSGNGARGRSIRRAAGARDLAGTKDLEGEVAGVSDMSAIGGAHNVSCIESFSERNESANCLSLPAFEIA